MKLEKDSQIKKKKLTKVQKLTMKRNNIKYKRKKKGE